MMKHLNWNSGFKPTFLIVSLCIAVTVCSTAMAAGSYSLTTSGESLLVGGSDCSSFMDGFAVGMAVGVLFGCVWCGAGAVIAKAVALFC